MPGTYLIYLHGAPAVGKLTIARSITNHISAKILDNHTLIDFAKSVLEFGTKEFFDLMGASRLLALEYAAKQKVPCVIMTSCYSDPEDRVSVNEIQSVVSKYEGCFLPVFLFCSQDAQYERVKKPDRFVRGKLTSVEGLQRFTQSWNFAPVLLQNCIHLETSISSPEEVAMKIINHFQLLSKILSPRTNP